MEQFEIQKIIKKTKKVLEQGGVILYPTDTIWGIGCDATNTKAIQKIYSIKNRNKKHPLILLMNDTNTLGMYVNNIPDNVTEIIKSSQKPTTIIYNEPKNLPETLIYNQTIAIRIIKESNLHTLLTDFNKPITSTSANISGKPTGKSLQEIDVEIIKQVDYIVPEKFQQNSQDDKSSRIIAIDKNSKIRIIRE